MSSCAGLQALVQLWHPIDVLDEVAGLCPVQGSAPRPPAPATMPGTLMEGEAWEGCTPFSRVWAEKLRMAALHGPWHSVCLAGSELASGDPAVLLPVWRLQCPCLQCLLALPDACSSAELPLPQHAGSACLCRRTGRSEEGRTQDLIGNELPPALLAVRAPCSCLGGLLCPYLKRQQPSSAL